MKHVCTPDGAPPADDFRIYFSAAAAASLVLDPSFRILAASDHYLELTMTRQEDILGHEVFEVFPDNPEDPAGRGQKALRASLKRVLRTGRKHRMTPLRYDIPRPAEQGGGFEQRWWAPVNAPAFNEDGAVCAIVHTVDDVTARRRLEKERDARATEQRLAMERYTALARGTQDAIWDWDLVTNRIEWNENLLKSFRHHPSRMSDPHAWLAAILPEDRDRVNRSITGVIEDPEGESWAEEYWFERGDGSISCVYDRGVVMRDEERRPVRMLGSMQDITERVERVEELKRVRAEMEAALRENRRILQHSLDIFLLVDGAGRLVRVSDAVRRTLGYDPSEMVGRSFTDFVHPDDLAASVEARARVKQGAPISTFRNRLVGRDGVPVPLMWSSIWVPEDEVSYAVGRDVTELVEAEREISRLAEHLSTTLESISQGCFTLDREWRFVYMNRQFEDFAGRDRKDLIGKVFLDEFPEARTSPNLKHYMRAMEEQVRVSFETYRPERDEWYEVIVYPNPDGIAILFRNITAWKLTAERLEEQAAAIDQAQDAIIIRDLDHRVKSWNRSAEQLYGYSEDEAIGRRIDQFLHTDPAAFERAAETLSREGQWSGELELRRADGIIRTVDARWSLLRRVDGTPHAILAIHTDLTERRQIEAQFLRVQRMESLGRLAGGIAHDLNNVLTPVLMAISLLRETAGDDALVHDTLDAMETSARRGADMVQQVLFFARGVEGKRVRVSLDEIIGQLRRMVEDTFPKGIRLEVVSEGGTRPVLGDATQLHQVLLNLCVNARDAFPDGQGTIRISTANIDVDEQYAAMNPLASAGAFVRLEVSDSGSGIPPGVIEHVFEPFFTTKDVGRGTGLGLATVQGIVKSHGGWINVYSERGRGSVFKIYLPADLGPAAAPGVTRAVDVERGRGELILLVDDELSILTITRRTLENFGYRVLTAENGAEAVALYSRHQDEVELVLTDMMMPIMDGLALIHALYRLNPMVRIIAASGLGANGSVARAAGAGVHDFLPKPYTAEAVLRLVRQLLDAPQRSGGLPPASPPPRPGDA